MTGTNTVHLIDDDPAILVAVAGFLRARGFTVRTYNGPLDFLTQAPGDAGGCVVTDMRMPDGDGLQVMQGVRQQAPETPVILLTAYGSVPDAVLAIKEGACDYFQKPISFEQLEAAAHRFLDGSDFAIIISNSASASFLMPIGVCIFWLALSN